MYVRKMAHRKICYSQKNASELQNRSQLEKCVKNKKMCQLKKWVTDRKIGHSWKMWNGYKNETLKKCVTVKNVLQLEKRSQ